MSGILTRKDLTSERFQTYIRDNIRNNSHPSKTPPSTSTTALPFTSQPLPTSNKPKANRGLNTLFGLEQLPPMTVKASDIEDVTEDWEYAGFDGINSKSILSEIKRHNIKNGKLGKLILLDSIRFDTIRQQISIRFDSPY